MINLVAASVTVGRETYWVWLPRERVFVKFAAVLYGFMGKAESLVADNWLALVPIIIGGLLIGIEAANKDLGFDKNGVSFLLSLS